MCLRLSTRSLSAALRMICLRCEVVEIGVGWGHVDSCGRGLRPGVWPSFQMGGDFHPSACGGDPLVWDGRAGWTQHARCPLGCWDASPRLGGLAATQREWRPAQSRRGSSPRTCLSRSGSTDGHSCGRQMLGPRPRPGSAMWWKGRGHLQRRWVGPRAGPFRVHGHGPPRGSLPTQRVCWGVRS